MNNKKPVFVIAGPTAVGKGTVLQEVMRQRPDLWYSVSATTRASRPGEIDGQHYYFITDTEFDQLIAEHKMLEWAVVHKVHRYGTPVEPINEALAAHKSVILEVDLAGARQVRQSMPQAVQIFIAPPSWEELERRLLTRGTEDAAEQARRLETAKAELAAQDEFDYVVINDSVANATQQIVQIIDSIR